jgi:hypothetical protein
MQQNSIRWAAFGARLSWTARFLLSMIMAHSITLATANIAPSRARPRHMATLFVGDGAI